MNVVVPLTNLSFLKDFYYPTCMQKLGSGRTVLEHTVDSLQLNGQYHFIINWNDHTKYSLGNYLNSTFNGAIVHVTRQKQHGDAESVLQSGVKEGPMVVFDARSVLLFNANALLNRVIQGRADACVAVHNHKRGLKVKVGGYFPNCVAKVGNVGNFAASGLYYFNDARHYVKVAPQIIRDELEMEYREIGVDSILNYLIEDGAKCLYHRCGRKPLETIDNLSRFSN